MTIADFNETAKDGQDASFVIAHWLDQHSAGVALAGCLAFWSVVGASLYYIL